MTPHVGYLIKQINDKIRARADANLRADDLTLAQSRVLKFLNAHGGVAAQKEIEAFLGVSHPTVVGIVARMERSGYLCAETDETDRRNKLVSLTERARLWNAQMSDVTEKHEAQMLSTLTPEQIDALTAMLITILENLNRQEPPQAEQPAEREPAGKEPIEI